jgi:hypothetical protein
MASTVLRSVRVKQALAEEVEALRGDRSFTEVVNRALGRWVRREKRRREDELVVAALRSRSPKRVRDEEAIVRQSSQSAARVLKANKP